MDALAVRDGVLKDEAIAQLHRAIAGVDRKTRLLFVVHSIEAVCESL